MTADTGHAEMQQEGDCEGQLSLQAREAAVKQLRLSFCPWPMVSKSQAMTASGIASQDQLWRLAPQTRYSATARLRLTQTAVKSGGTSSSKPRKLPISHQQHLHLP